MATTGNHTVTTGVVGSQPDRVVYNRLEINDFVKNVEQFSLYVQALRHLMDKVDPQSWVSYYQIAGIHGAPYQPWDGAGKPPPSDPPRSYKGYCTHGSAIFPTWHRPYVALIEQEIQKIAIVKAKDYEVSQDRWTDAAVSLRQPYWDWSATARPPAFIYEGDTLMVALPPNGQMGEVANPFKSYSFPANVDPGFADPFDKDAWKDRTRRCAAYDEATKTVKENVAKLLENIDGIGNSHNEFKSRRMETAILMTSVNTWGRFSREAQNTVPPPARGPARSSLESLHSLIHTGVGGTGTVNGHMRLPATAAFDPIFWLHHSQTDRLLALWAALHPLEWVTESLDLEGTWTIYSGGAVNADTDLTPFYCTSEDDQFWKSADLRLPPDGLFGYSYPEFEGLDMSDRAAVRAQIVQKVKELYNANVTVQQWHAFHTAEKGPYAPAGLPAPRPPQSRTITTRSPGGSQFAHTPVVLRWSAHITVKKYAVGGSFSVIIFLGPVPAHADEYRKSASYVGEYAAFVNTEPQRCGNCVALGDITVGGSVSLNDAIIERAEVRSLDPSEVVPYLRRELSWRVHGGPDGSVHPGTVRGLEVDISATPIYLVEKEDDFYPEGEPQVYHEVTRARPGGCRHSADA